MMAYRQRLREELRERLRVEYLGQLILHSKEGSLRRVMIGEIVLLGNDNLERID